MWRPILNCWVKGKHNIDMEKNKNGEELFPLRIDARTVIYVTKDKCNEQYALRKRLKFNKGLGKPSLSDMNV